MPQREAVKDLSQVRIRGHIFLNNFHIKIRYTGWFIPTMFNCNSIRTVSAYMSWLVTLETVSICEPSSFLLLGEPIINWFSLYKFPARC
jgi:hypothetical protein